MRRKMVRHSLGALFSADTLAACGIDLRQRPEEISVAQYVALAEGVLVNRAATDPAATIDT